MRLPDFFYRMEPVGAVLRAIEGGEAVLTARCSEKNDQLSVRTATEGLSLWEQDYALSDGRAEDTETRRGRIHAALLGGQTLTVSALKQLAMSLNGADDGAVDEDFTDYHVTLTALYDEREPLPVGTALQEAVEWLKPAHLTVDIVSAMRVRGEMHRYHTLSGKVYLILPAQRTI